MEPNELHFKGKHNIAAQRVGPSLNGLYYVVIDSLYDSGTDVTTAYLEVLE